MSLTPTKFTQDTSTEYSSGVSITSDNLNSIQKGILYNNSKIDQLLSTISSLQTNITNLTTQINNLKIVKKNISVPVSAWTKSNTYTEYPYQGTIAVENITKDMIPYICFPQEMITSLTLSPVCDTYNGGVHIYAQSEATKAFTIPTMIFYTE